MAKFGYACKCGWRLSRTGLTRKQYADAKRKHANGSDDKPGCEFLAEELGRTKVSAPKVESQA